MGQADRDQPAQASPITAGTIDGAADQAGQPSPPGRGQADGQTGPASRTPLPARLRAAWDRAAVRQLTALAGFLVVGVAMTWPRVTYLIGGVLPASRDSASYVWGFWWVARQVTHLANPWFTSYLAAPAGVQIGFHTLMPLPGVLLLPVTLTAGPAFSYNLMVILVPGLLAYAMYRAARLWLRSGVGAVAAGAFFGYSAMLTQQSWYHVNIAAGALFLPLALEASVRLRRSPGRRPAIILGLVMGAAVLTDQESAVLAAVVAGLALAPWLIRRPSRERAWPVATAIAVGGVIASPQIVAMVQETLLKGGLSIHPKLLAISYLHYGIGLPGMFSPTPRVNDFGLGVLAQPFLHGRDNEGMPMFGVVLTALAVAGIVTAWRRRGTWLLATLWLGCAALALGPTLWIGKHEYVPLASTWTWPGVHGSVTVSDLMPYTWFVHIPGLSSFREADRLAILGLLPAALLAGATIDWLRDHANAVIVVVLALGVLEAGYSGYSGSGPRVGRISASYPRLDRWILADHSRSVVLDIPFGLRGGIPENGVPFWPQALVMATEDGHPRSIAYTSRLPYQTVNQINAHPFYAHLIGVQHFSPPSCPWRLPTRPTPSLPSAPPLPRQTCLEPTGVWLLRPGLPARTMAAARRDARRMDIRWAVVWKRNPSSQNFILPYLSGTGFRFFRAVHMQGKWWALLYRRA